jgi:hypothetical protein
MLVTYVSISGAFGATNTDLSKKYQTLVTPAGWAFSIWGPIFIWEGVFTIAQMLPRYRASPVLPAIAPFWWAACLFQVTWSLVFAQEWITGALVMMLSILAALLCLLWYADSVQCTSLPEFWLLRAPFSLHAGWIIAASAVNASVQADYVRASAPDLLALAVMSLTAVFAVSIVFAVAVPRPDAIICIVAAWALRAVGSELVAAKYLLDPTKHNFIAWDPVVLDGVGTAATSLSVAILGLAVYAAAFRVWRSQSAGPAISKEIDPSLGA